ncbi:MAG: mechanosensitive ion channel family protein [Planctomycetes bacterium]|nr:mechanosensitive ion channel family protein [Planctomycetota bacterium]
MPHTHPGYRSQPMMPVRDALLTILAILALLLSPTGSTHPLSAGVSPARAQEIDQALPVDAGQDESGSVDEPDAQEAEEAVAEQPPALTVRPEYDSPRSTMMTFLTAMGEYADEPNKEGPAMKQALDCFNWPDAESDTQPHEIAIELLGILNRLGEVKNGQLLNRSRLDDLTEFTYYPVMLSVSGSLRYAFERPPFVEDERRNLLYFPPFAAEYPEGRITFTQDARGEWKFSAATTADIDRFYRAVYDVTPRFGIDERDLSTALWLRGQFPRTMREQSFAGLEYWQWCSLLVLIFAGILLDHLVRRILALASMYYIRRKGASASNETLQRTVRPFGLLAAGLLWLGLLYLLGLPAFALKVLLIAIRLIVMVAGVWSSSRLVDLICEALASKAERTATKFDDVLIPLLRRTLKIFIIVFGLIYIANAFEIEILPLLTGLGIGGAAIAFASKDTIENFFGSVAVIADRPFEVGDWVVIGDVEGTVETLGFRSTRVRTFYNSLVTIPNANLVRANVDNYGRRKYRRYKTHVGIAYDTPPDLVEAYCEGIREIVRAHPYTRKDYFQVWLNQFSAASIDILIYIFHETPDWSTELRERQRFMLDIMRLAERLGVEFAFPTQTLYLRQDEAPEHNRKTATESDAQRRGREAAARTLAGAAWQKQTPGPYVFDQCALPDHDLPDEDDGDSQVESTIGGDG